MLCLQSNYLVPVITNVTRLASKVNDNGIIVKSATLIDNIIIKANTRHISGVIETNISDHFLIFTTIPLTVKKIDKNCEIKYRSINECNQRKFTYQLTHSDISNILNVNDGKIAFSMFFKTFNDLHDRY